MSKKAPRGSLLVFLCLITLNCLAQQKCPFRSISARPFFAGYPDRDSLLVTEILGTRKLATKLDGFEVISFEINTSGEGALYTEARCNSNEITSEAAALLKRAATGQKLFLDHVHAANNSGQIYCLQTVPFYISKSPIPESCPTLPYKAFIAGHPDSTRLTVDQLLKSGGLGTTANGYEIISFAVGTTTSRGGLVWCGEIRNTNADFSTDTKGLIGQGKPGQTFFIDAIRLKNKAGQVFCLDSFKLVIR